MFQRLDNLTSFNKNISLDQSLIRALSVPFFTYRHAHKSIELFGAAILVGQVFYPVFLRKLFVPLLRLIDLNAFESIILPLFLKLFDFTLTDLIKTLLFGFHSRIINSFASPCAPTLLKSRFYNRFADLTLDLLVFLSLEFLVSIFFLSDKERFEHLGFICSISILSHLCIGVLIDLHVFLLY